MSNLQQQAELCQKIHELLPQINQKYGLEIKVESDKKYYKLSKDTFIHKKGDIIIAQYSEDIDYLEDGGAILDIEGISRYGLIAGDNYSLVYSIPEPICPVLEEKQIRQILVGLQEVLGESRDLIDLKKKLDEIAKKKVELKNKIRNSN